MKASELRIGNWVLINNSEQQIGLSEIFSMKSIEVLSIEGVDKSINPIPLTEEWVERFGFKLYDYEPDRDDPDFIFKDYRLTLKDKEYFYTICECPNDTWDFGIKVSWAEHMLLGRIKHVHQLQNLYHALTGEEL